MFILLKFFLFQNPDNLSDLSLCNVRLNEKVSLQLLEKLQFQSSLLRLRLSNTNLQATAASDMLCEFLERNDLIVELDLSYC